MRGLTLALDAAATTGTIALLRDGRLVAERAVSMRSDAEERFLPAILETIISAGAPTKELDQLVCGEGPGSFTSLRVAGAIAKGLCHGLGRPLFAVPSLALIVAADARTTEPGTRWLATLDAMRGDRYLALVEVGAGGEVTSVESLGLTPVALIDARAIALGATLIGPAEEMAAEPHARGVARLLGLAESAGQMDLGMWEPRYGRLAEAQVKWEAVHGPLR